MEQSIIQFQIRLLLIVFGLKFILIGKSELFIWKNNNEHREEKVQCNCLNPLGINSFLK